MRSLLAAALATLVAFAVLIGLGIWQLQRLAWKDGLIAAIAERAHAAPVPAPHEVEWRDFSTREAEYRRVDMRGVYDPKGQALVFRALQTPHGRASGPGYFVITAFRPTTGGIVLVNRGFVPEDRKAEATRLPRGEVPVVGLLRASEVHGAFTPSDDPVRGLWFTRDIAAIAKAGGLGEVAPFSVDAEAGALGELPQGGETPLTFPNNHAAYAATWFGLAAALVLVFGLFARTRLREIRG